MNTRYALRLIETEKSAKCLVKLVHAIEDAWKAEMQYEEIDPEAAETEKTSAGDSAKSFIELCDELTREKAAEAFIFRLISAVRLYEMETERLTGFPTQESGGKQSPHR